MVGYGDVLADRAFAVAGDIWSSGLTARFLVIV